MIVIEKDVELLLGKCILEIGFTTGLPSMLALDAGANEVTLHSWDQQSMATYVKGTVRRNAIPKSLVKFTTGELETCMNSLKGKKFDVILCPELINTNEESFPLIHQILDNALAEHGVILLSGRSFYDNVSGSISAFIDYLKSNGTFDAFIRWTSSRNEANPRKLLQITRC
jgi:predicted nicotinamide N-methyase